MSNKAIYALLWVVWAMLAGLTAAGTVTNKIASEATSAELQLRHGEELTLPIYRLFPATFSFALIFATKPNEPHLELGNWDQPKKTAPSVLVFNNPGEPILIQVTVVATGESQVFEALPAGGTETSTTKARDFVPYIADGDTKRFSWPPAETSYLKLGKDANTLRFKVVEVGQPIENKTAQLFIDPALSFKSSRAGYSWLWWFYFWPAYALLLAIAAALLVFVRLQGRRRNEDNN